MNKGVKTLVYGKTQECLALVEMLKAHPLFVGKKHEYNNVDSHDDFQVQLVEWTPNLAIVLADGVAGMEGVYLVRNNRPDTPVFWFSDDYNFGMQSHRLECKYFATKPVTTEKINKALRQCDFLGID